MTESRLSIWILAGINLCIMMGLGLVGPVLPLYAQSFRVSYGVVGLLIAVFPLVRLFTNLPSGLLGARYGERRVCAAGASLVACGAFLSGSAPAFGWLIAGQALQGLGSSLFVTNSMSFIMRVTPNERMGKTMSLYQASFSTGVSVGPIFGGFLAGVGGLNLPFFGYGTLAAVSATLSWLFIRTPAAGSRPEPQPAGLLTQREALRGLFRNYEYVMALLLTLVIFWIRAGARHTALPLFARDVAGLDTLSIGVLLTVIQVTNLIILWPAGWAVDRSRKIVTVGAYFAVALAVTLFGWADSFSGLIVTSVLFGICTGFSGVSPSVIASDVMPAHVRGAGVGVFRMAGDIGFIIGPVMSGFAITHFGYFWTFALNGTGALIVALLTLRMKETLRPILPQEKDVGAFVAERAGGMPP